MNDMTRDFDMAQLNRLLKKYTNIYSMYVEYPHKSVWTADVGDSAPGDALGNLFSKDKNAPLLLYVHIPFCPTQCYYCTCHTYLTRNYERVREYLRQLYSEVDLYRGIFDRQAVKPAFREIHLGGGSPGMLHREEFDELLEKLGSIADLKSLNEFSIEVDPRATTVDRLRYYHEKGINRISFGVQDFDPDVQKAINRVQPAELVENLLTPEMRRYFHGINFDIVWGLPKQTRVTFKRTIETTIRLLPDRISLLMLHYAPDVKPHQKNMNPADFPGLEEKTAMFHDAIATLLKNGYVRIGLDHFVRPGDDLARALNNKTLRWNNLGYTAGRYSDILGLGPWSASAVTPEYYFQNVASLKEYEDALKSGRLPVYRGYKLNRDDIIRRDVIHSLRIYFSVDFAEIEKKHNIVFSKYFKAELAVLGGLAADGILELSGAGVTVTEKGKYFTMYVCRVFDNHK